MHVPMRITKLLSIYFLIIGFSVVLAYGRKNNDDKTAVVEDDNDDDSDIGGGMLEINPHYVPPEPSDNDDDDDDDLNEEVEIEYDDDEESDDDDDVAESDIDIDDDEMNEKTKRKKKEKMETTKSVLGKALISTKQSKNKAVVFMKKHRVKMTIAIALFAFRKEISQYIWNQIAITSSVTVDPKTGAITKVQRRKISPTSILKVLIFIDVLRKIQNMSTSSGGGHHQGEEDYYPSSSALLLAGSKNPFIGGLLSTIFQPYQAYILPIEQHFTFERINDRYVKDMLAFKKAKESCGLGLEGGLRSTTTSSNDPLRRSIMFPKLSKKSNSSKSKKNKFNGTAIILDLENMEMGTKNRFDLLRDEVNFLIHQHRIATAAKNVTLNSTTTTNSANNKLEIIVLLESPGGGAQEFGMAAQQLLRLRNEPGIDVTICVDKVAASGGYMMACTSSPGRLIAAPFAVVGSIGVIGQAINIQKALLSWGVTPLVFRGGKDKAPVGLIGDVTQKDIDNVQGMVNSVHVAFKRHVSSSRPMTSKRIDKLATGDIWLGYDAIDNGLIDRLCTSDEYINERLQDGARILKLVKYNKRRLSFHRPSSSPFAQMKNMNPSLLLSSPELYNFQQLVSSTQNILSKFSSFLDTHLLNTATGTAAVDNNNDEQQDSFSLPAKSFIANSVQASAAGSAGTSLKL